jgi:hypothetical protein
MCFARKLAATFVALGVAAALAGCSHKRSEVQLKACQANLAKGEEVVAIRRLYKEGKLGTAAQIRAETGKEHAFMTASGTISPYDRMTAWQRASFDEWVVSPRPYSLARYELGDADSLAAKEAKSRCG